MRFLYALAGTALVLSSVAVRAESLDSDRWQPLASQIPDVRVLDQNGHLKRFYTDLVKDRTVAIQFIFTSCTTICTPLGATFRSLQNLQSSTDSGVQLISISVDPVHDTPEELLRKFAGRFGTQSGWTLVTGEPGEIERLLKALRTFTQDKNTHSAMILIGNDHLNRWTRAYGLSPASSLQALLLEGARGTK